MSGIRASRVEIDGRPARVEDIWAMDLSHPSHFTAMQVAGGKTAGLDFHLARLDAATRELFGVGLDGGRVRGAIRHALADDTAGASVRVHVFRPRAAGDVSVVVTVRPPSPAPSQAQRLQTVEYQRPLAHIKHDGGFGQAYYQSLAHGNGFDEALFAGPDGSICEGSITNIGFIERDAVIWPDAPALRGVMMSVLQRELSSARVSWRHAQVRRADLASFDGAFVTNARGLATVARIDDLRLPVDAPLMRTAVKLLAAARRDPV